MVSLRGHEGEEEELEESWDPWRKKSAVAETLQHYVSSGEERE